MLKFLAVVVGVIVVGFALLSWLSLSWVYADGERAGYVQKFSRKGYVCKTWEGQMAMVTMPGTLAEKFDFTVRDPAVAKLINDNIGARLALHYEQHKWIPSSCFGETDYFVTRVTVADQPQPLPSGQPGATAPVPAPPPPAAAPATTQ
ncbi:MAG TPA: hypothetical protein VL994_09375 [Steroidobacteraceae bacterium]|nr:hypothetical protein [Steroidobacteraceae bacterium]